MRFEGTFLLDTTVALVHNVCRNESTFMYVHTGKKALQRHGLETAATEAGGLRNAACKGQGEPRAERDAKIHDSELWS